MGVIAQGILGGVSGKVGNVIGANWKGIDYVRIMPASVANPKTDKQLTARQKLTVTTAFCKACLAFIQVGFRFLAIKMSAYNACFSANNPANIQGTYPNQTIDYPNAKVSSGELEPALNPAVVSTVAATVHSTWDDNSTNGNANASDIAQILIYNPAKKQSVAFLSGVAREAATSSNTVPNSFSGDLVHVYIAFTNLDGSMQANSMYAGSVTVA